MLIPGSGGCAEGEAAVELLVVLGQTRPGIALLDVRSVRMSGKARPRITIATMCTASPRCRSLRASTV